MRQASAGPERGGRARGEAAEQAWAQNSLALIYERQGRYAEALAIAEDALVKLQAARDSREGIIENCVGWLHAHLGNLDQALMHCEGALRKLRRVGTQGPIGDTLDSIGFIHGERGDFALAADFYRQAIAQYRTYGDQCSEARAMTGLNRVHKQAGDCGAGLVEW